MSVLVSLKLISNRPHLYTSGVREIVFVTKILYTKLYYFPTTIFAFMWTKDLVIWNNLMILLKNRKLSSKSFLPLGYNHCHVSVVLPFFSLLSSHTILFFVYILHPCTYILYIGRIISIWYLVSKISYIMRNIADIRNCKLEFYIIFVTCHWHSR